MAKEDAPRAHPIHDSNPFPAQDLRVGHGYDLHRLEPRSNSNTRPLIVGGVALEFDRGPIARSDGDVLLHAVTDALLGAIAGPDIGQLFPDSDPAHEGEDSSRYVLEALRRAHADGFAPISLDATVILERPKLGAHKQAIRDNLARLLGMPTDRVNVKGKTHEGVDALGEGRAIEAHCVVLLARR
ncbi:MAG: 2-C-methyl-D-erythritol 2,4-cyclodiphosphate synthase [Phycisphaerales bacterium]